MRNFQHCLGFVASSEFWRIAIPTALSAFFGSLAAFAFQWGRERIASRTREILAGNQALFVLTEQADRLLRVRSDFLDPSRNHPERWIGVPAVADELDISRIEFQSLGFLFEQTGSKLEGAVLLQELFASQRQTESAIETLRKRSDFHLQEIQPALDTLPEEVLRERFIPVDKIGAALGERRVGMLKSFTEAVYQSFDWAVSANEQAFGRLRAFLVHRYPKSRFIERVLKVPTQPDTSSPFRPL